MVEEVKICANELCECNNKLVKEKWQDPNYKILYNCIVHLMSFFFLISSDKNEDDFCNVNEIKK